MLDLIIKNGKVVDGTGNTWYYGDVGIKDGIIAKVGRVEQESKQIVDAGSQVISPGFIDGHCHSDLMILAHPECEVKLQQGVTTEVVGNCGLAPAPVVGKHSSALENYIQPVLGSVANWSWGTVKQYMDAVHEAAPSLNMCTYAAHGALRIAAMGFERRPAAANELLLMKDILRDSLDAGAIGMSLGLVYAPGSFAPTDELIELSRVLAERNLLLSAHVRGEGSRLLDSVREVLKIAESSGVALQISHLKAAGKQNWGQVSRAIEIIEDARSRGVDVTCDVYPYTAGSTTLTSMLPGWVLEGGHHAMLERLGDRSQRKKIKHDLNRDHSDWDNVLLASGWDSVYISSVQTVDNKRWEGQHLLQISQNKGMAPDDCMLDLLLEEHGKIAIVIFFSDEKEVNQIIRWDASLVASDSLYCLTGKPHPRLYGCFPRLFAKCVREDRLISLEQAVRKVTSFPAQRFKMAKRGLLVPGYAADITVFDPNTVSDKATYRDPQQYPEGISYVFVGGMKTVQSGMHQHARNGAVLSAQSCSGVI